VTKPDTKAQDLADRVTLIRWLVDEQDYRPSEAQTMIADLPIRDVRNIARALTFLAGWKAERKAQP
jgi:hypothetical protein